MGLYEVTVRVHFAIIDAADTEEAEQKVLDMLPDDGVATIVQVDPIDSE